MTDFENTTLADEIFQRPRSRDELTWPNIRVLWGGRSGQSWFVGPTIEVKKYKTVACGWAEEISAKEGEVGVCLHGGGPRDFAKWIVGPVREIVSFLSKRKDDRAQLIEEDRARALIPNLSEP